MYKDMYQVDQEAEKADKNPTELQKKAGNYAMGHVTIRGFKISIENAKGSYRKYKNEDGSEGQNLMHNHYGYFSNTEGHDGDHIDVFIGGYMDFDKVFVVDQKNKDDEFDESKVMLGFRTKEEAKKAYLSNYTPDWKGFMAITEVGIDKFKKWLYDGCKQRKPFSEYVEIKKISESSSMLVGDIPKEYYPSHHPSWDNIFWQAETNRHLYEGIFATYPIEKVRKYLMSYYKLPPQAVTIYDNNGDQSLRVLISNTPENKEKMDKSLALCGYFPSYVSPLQNEEFLVIDYEKRINENAEDIVKKNRYIYHITPSINLDKIEELGLCPKSQNKEFLYPNRIYFYIGKMTPKDVVTFGNMLYPHIKQTEYTKANKIYDSFALIQVDTRDLDFDEVSFYKDPNLDNAIYTVDNIPPESVFVKYRNINIMK